MTVQGMNTKEGMFEKQMHRLRTDLRLPGVRTGGRDRQEFGMDMYTLLYLKLISTKGPIQGTASPAQCYVAAWLGVEFWGESIHLCVQLSHFAVYLKLKSHIKQKVKKEYLILFADKRKTLQIRGKKKKDHVTFEKYQW